MAKGNTSKRYKKAREVVDLEKPYSLNEAVGILSKMPKAKFDETVEISANLGVDPKQGEEMVRGVVALPHGSGKQVRVLVFTENPKLALDAGADFAGLDDLIKKIEGGWMDFDVAISTTSAMKEARKVARVLGPRGLMPNPKSGTVTDDIAAGIKAVKGGRIEFKMDKTANLAVIIGKRSFKTEQLVENAKVAVEAVKAARPGTFTGGIFIKSLTMSSSMSPGIRLETSEFKSI